MKKELLDSNGRTSKDLLSCILPEFISIDLKGGTKEEIITELVDMLAEGNRLENRDVVLADVFHREKMMSTGMAHSIALPHAKTDGVEELAVAIGIKKEGIDFGAMDGEKSRLIILIVSPKNASCPHIQFIAAVGSQLRDSNLCEEVINADSPEKVAELLCKIKKDEG